MHLHVSVLEWLNSALNFIIFIIPLKIIAANFVGRNALADALYSVV